MTTLVRDLRHALRMFRREPALVAGIVCTFALAIATNATMFGLVTRLMLAPPPGVRAAEQVAQIRLRVGDDERETFLASTTSYPTFRALRDARGAFASVAASRTDSVMLGRGPDAAPLAVLGTSGDYFTTLGTRAAVGRLLGPADDALPSGAPVIVLGHAYWQRAFHGDRAVLGRALVVDGEPFTVVGVAPAGFNGDGLAPVDAFVPLTASLRHRAGDWYGDAYLNLVSIVVRLRDGVATDAARQFATAALRASAPSPQRRGPSVELAPLVPGRAARESPQARIALWLAGTSLVVLLVATANVGTLLSLRWARRRRDVATRIALGARRVDLARRQIVEGVLLAGIGAACGVLLSRWSSELVRVTLLPDVAADAFADRRVLVASIVGGVAAGFASGLAPLAQARRANVAAQLASGGAHGSSARLGVQRTLVAAQAALCTLLLVGAGLFVRSLERVRAQDLGFSTERLIYVSLDFRDDVPAPQRDETYRDAERRVRTLAGVAAVTAVAGIPFGPHDIPPVSIPGLADMPTVGGQLPIMYGATPGYLDMMRVALLRGRLLTRADGAGAPLVVLVNETMARAVWPRESALGKCVRAGFGRWPVPDGENPAESAPCREVVGVVRDSRARSLRPEANEDRLMQYYVPFEQMPRPPFPDVSQIMGLVVRARGAADRAAADVQRAIQSSTSRRLFVRARPYQDLIDPQLRSWRLGATLFAAFGALALLIAAVGSFAVVSYAVAQRTRELGVRLALGGTRRDVAWLVVRDALGTVGAGLAVGVVASVVAAPAIAPLLFHTSPREPATLAAAASVLLVAALAAAARPAWRAGRVNPVTALRAE